MTAGEMPLLGMTPLSPLVLMSYDRIAEQWHRSRGAMQPSLERLLGEALADLPAVAAVLDVGCGSGVPVAAWLAARGHRVTGIDASGRLLEIASREVPTATFVLGDMRVAEPGGPFDAIVAWDSVFHIPRIDHATVFARFARWLRPGGALVLSLGGSEWEGTSEMHGETFFYSGFAPDDSLRVLRGAGFEVRRAEIDDPSSRGHLAVLARRAAGSVA